MSTDAQGRPEPEPAADEATTLRQFLEWQRRTLAWKTDGLTDAELRRTLAPSAITLGGLLGHLAWVEDFWCGHRLRGAEPLPRWRDLDWDADPDGEWHLELPGDELRAVWREAVERSDAAIEAALVAGGADTLEVTGVRGSHVTLRWILIHLIEEYARHNGHADLLRESIDGAVGE